MRIMKRNQLMLLAISACLLTSEESANAQQGLSNYFPLRDGDCWQYVTESFGSVDDSLQYCITGDTTFSGVTYKVMQVKDFKFGSSTEFYRADSAGNILQYDVLQGQPSILYAFANKSGDYWPCRYGFGHFDSSFVTTVFDTSRSCITVGFYSAPDTLPGASAHWHVLVAGIGLLNDESLDGGGVLTGARIDGTVYGVITAVHELASSPPATFSLKQNYPNPFNPLTRISFDLLKNEIISLKVYDVLGRNVATLVSGPVISGHHSLDWNATGLSTGVYFCRLGAGQEVQTIKLVHLK